MVEGDGKLFTARWVELAGFRWVGWAEEEDKEDSVDQAGGQKVCAIEY